jgi:hypothetical protein
MTGSPWRDDPGTTPVGRPRRCALCAASFTPAGRQRFCSSACRKRAFRARHAPPPAPAVPPGGRRRAHTVYECPDCGQRQAGVQWCAECVRPTRAVGLGGDCPHCGEPVTAGELGLAEGPRR